MKYPGYPCVRIRPASLVAGDLAWYYGRLARIESITGPTIRFDDSGSLKGAWFTFKFTEVDHRVKFHLTGHYRADCWVLVPDYTDITQFTQEHRL